MERGHRVEEQPVARHGEVDAGHRHQQRGQAAEHRDDDDQGEDHAPGPAEQGLARQGREGLARSSIRSGGTR